MNRSISNFYAPDLCGGTASEQTVSRFQPLIGDFEVSTVNVDFHDSAMIVWPDLRRNFSLIHFRPTPSVFLLCISRFWHIELSVKPVPFNYLNAKLRQISMIDVSSLRCRTSIPSANSGPAATAKSHSSNMLSNAVTAN